MIRQRYSAIFSFKVLTFDKLTIHIKPITLIKDSQTPEFLVPLLTKRNQATQRSFEPSQPKIEDEAEWILFQPMVVDCVRG